MIPQNLSDPGLVGAVAHGAGYRSRLGVSGPEPRPSTSCVPSCGLLVSTESEEWVVVPHPPRERRVSGVGDI